MKPLLILTADGQCKATLQGFFERPQYNLSLGCGPIELNGITFNPEQDISVHPKHDPGVWSKPQEVLLAAGKIYNKALVVLDEAWEGAPPPEAIVANIETLVVKEAKWSRDRFEVILIRPELEAWIWQRNTHVLDAFGFPGGQTQLWTLFEQQSLRLNRDTEKHYFVPANPLVAQPPAWPSTASKPENPKGLVEALSAHCASGPASEIFSSITSTISVKKCADPAFHRLRDTLQAWFPLQNPRWAR
jgi:hypothetical protein